MLKVGDKVKVREDLIYDRTEPGVTDVMLGFRGKEMTIKEVIEDEECYIFLEDESEHYWTERMFEKNEEREGNNMKELTFREVIASIKEGEVWENNTERIIGLGFGRIKIEWLKGDRDSINLNFGYTIKRPQYTFQEAFKAFEEGKEIESCVTKDVYKERTNGEVWLMSTEEIKGKWYIND